MTTIFMFPGQSSRYPEMVERIAAAAPDVVRPLLQQASEVLGRDLAWHYRSAHSGIFATNRDVQVGVFLTSHLHLAALEASEVKGALSLGLSLGEYNHLVHIGALSFVDALRLVDARGQAFDSGPAGAMACVFPIRVDELESVVDRARVHGVLDIANFNSPSQLVLSGEGPAVAEALRILDEEYMVESVVIEPHIPMHSRCFWPVQAAFRPFLERAPWRPPARPYLPNVLGRPLTSPRTTDFIELLSRHLCEPVRWRDSIDYVVRLQPGAAFLEVGPRGVLYNLLQRRWHRVTKLKTDGETDVAFQAVARELASAS